MWIARDRNGQLFAYADCPIKNEEKGFFTTSSEMFRLNQVRYPEVTWEDSPIHLVSKQEQKNGSNKTKSRKR